MHPFLLLLGSAAVTYSQMLGHTWLAGAVAVIGGLLQALSKRSKIPMLRALPKFAAPGSGFAIALSVVCLVLGAIMIGTPIVSTSQLGLAGHIFLPVVGSGLLMLFDTADLSGVPGTPPTVIVLALSVWAASCAHVQPVTNCLEGKAGNQATAILAEVENDLMQQNWDDLLLVLGPQLGWDVLACALDELQNNTNPTVAARAKTFESAHADKLHSEK